MARSGESKRGEGIQRASGEPSRNRPVRWDAEEEAKHILSAVLSGQSRGVDPGGGRVQLRDFDHVLTSGEWIAVEVTRENDPRQLEFAGAVGKAPWTVRDLKATWVLKVGGSPSVRRLRQEVHEHLPRLERAGFRSLHLDVRMFTDVFLPRHEQSALRSELVNLGAVMSAEALARLGIRLAYAVLDSDPGTVIIGRASSGGTLNRGSLVRLAERLANLPDNAAKLAVPEAFERHLFIWVESSSETASAALEVTGVDVPPGALELEAPQIPSHVDVIWLASAFDRPRVWRFTRRTGWTDLGPATKWGYQSPWDRGAGYA